MKKILLLFFFILSAFYSRGTVLHPPLCLQHHHLLPAFPSLQQLQAIRFGHLFHLFGPS